MFSDEQFLKPMPNVNRDKWRVRKYIIGGGDIVLLTTSKVDGDFLIIRELDLPENAKVVAISIIPCPPSVALYIEHPSFEPLDIGAYITLAPVVVKIVKLAEEAYPEYARYKSKPTEEKSEASELISLLIKECIEHNSDYYRITSQELLDKAERFLKRIDH